MVQSKDFFTRKKEFTIFAIIAEDDGDTLAFVGKTETHDLESVLRRHLRGEVSWTKDDFSSGATTSPPRIIALAYLMCTGAEAYKHTLCWYRILEEKSYMMIAPDTFDKQAYNLNATTEKIYRNILETIPVDDILCGKETPAPCTNENTENPTLPCRELTQMNIRIHSSDRDAFYRICRTNNYTQREGFLHLLTSYSLMSNQEKQSATDRLLAEKDATIAAQRKSIQELERKLANKSRGQAADAKLKMALHNANMLLRKYIALIFPAPAESPLRCLSFKMWKKTCYNAPYAYPPGAGCSIIRLESICYGKGVVPAVFIHGHDTETGEFIKLRYYPSRYFVGISPKNPYEQLDSLWLVGYAPATDGAIALTFALPLLRQTYSAPEEKKDNFPALDDIIRKIKQYNH